MCYDKYYCEECNLEFNTFQAKANHHRWKHLKYNFKNVETKQKSDIKRSEKWRTFNVNCHKCGKEILIKEYNTNKPKKENYYCSRACANSHIRTQESKEKIRTTLKDKISRGEKIGFIDPSKVKPYIKTYCINCGKETNHRMFCSKECRHEYRTKDYTSYQKYRLACCFAFALNDFPEEFDFSLVEKYGWYKAKNRGDNTNGISRDHMFSVKEGFLQGVDPKLISHPANCNLLRHNDNMSKNKKCSITLEELEKRINDWNSKYNASVAQLRRVADSYSAGSGFESQ